MELGGAMENRLGVMEFMDEYTKSHKAPLQLRFLQFAEEVAAIQSESMKEMAQKLEVYVADQVERRQPSMVEVVIQDMLDVAKRPGYVSWIDDPKTSFEVLELIADMRSSLRNRSGNDCRQGFEGLWTKYMKHLDVKASANDLNTKIEDFSNAFRDAVSEDDAYLVNRVKFAAHAIRAVGNEKSHYTSTGADRLLSEPDIVQLCGNLGVIGSAIDTLAVAFKRYQQSRPKSPPLPPPAASPSHSLFNQPPRSSGSPPKSVQSTPSAVRVPPPPPGFLSPPAPPVNTTTTTSTTQNSSSPSWIQIAGKKQSPVVSRGPSLNLDAVSTYKLFTPLDNEDNRKQNFQFGATIRQYEEVVDAQYCGCGNPDGYCHRPHKYLDAMAYNPLYKQFVCRQADHYYGLVEEIDWCVGVHVDTGFKTDFHEEKQKLCPKKERCPDERCLKSHIFEEVCWYNPRFKTEECTKHLSGPSPSWCTYYHSHDKTDRRNSKEYVGKAVKMPFIERTHKRLADALEALRVVRANGN